MQRRTYAVAAIAFALSTVSSTGAMATAQRTFVASSGNDANPCSLTQPCRGFARAVTQTNTSGEVIVLDSAGYGPVVITKSVSIDAPAGVYAGISVFSGNGVTVNASSTDSVTLRGLAINAQGGTNGVNFSAGGKLEIDRCTISGAFTNGIEINGPVVANVVVKDTHISGVVFNGSGIHVEGPGGELIRLTVTDSVLSDVGSGIFVEAGAEVAIENTRLIGIGGLDLGNGEGVYCVVNSALHGRILAHVSNSYIRGFATGVAVAQFAPYVVLSVTASEVSHNLYAVGAFSGATIALSGNHIAHNNVAISASSGGGVVYTSGTNYSTYNGSAGDPVAGPGGLF